MNRLCQCLGLSWLYLPIMIILASVSISKKDRQYSVVNCCFLFQHEINHIGVMLSKLPKLLWFSTGDPQMPYKGDFTPLTFEQWEVLNSKWPGGGSYSSFSFKTTEGELCLLTLNKLFYQKTYCAIRIFLIQFKEKGRQNCCCLKYLKVVTVHQ